MFEDIKRLPQIIYNWITPNLSAFISSRQPQMWVLSLIIGLLVSIAAIIFREGIGLVQLLWLGDASENVASAARKIHWLWILFTPTIGGLLVGLALYYFTDMRRTNGIPDVIEARAKGGRELKFWPGIGSALITMLSLGSGASAGREGPMVHLGATLAAAITRVIKLPDWSQRTLLACGVASAVAASFNAPIAGVLFAHEVILGHYAMRCFVPIVIASASGSVISHLWFGNMAAFTIPSYSITSYWEFPAFALLGIICASVAILFQFSLISADYIARHVHLPLWARPTIGGFLVGLIAIYFPEVLGVGYEATDLALRHNLPLAIMIILIFAKTIATSITIASRFGGGIIAPSLFVGAMAGGSFGIIAALLVPDMASSEGLYAILGMGAVAAAVIGAPFSTTLMVFELTGGFSLSVALLLTVSIASGLTQAIHGHSFFQWQLKARGLVFRDGAHQYLMKTTKVADFMDVKTENGEIEIYNEHLDTPSLKVADTLEYALRAFDSGGHMRLPVVDVKDNQIIIGWATQIAALRHFNGALIDANVEEHR
jgi:CIC family chloride channel protein